MPGRARRREAPAPAFLPRRRSGGYAIGGAAPEKAEGGKDQAGIFSRGPHLSFQPPRGPAGEGIYFPKRRMQL